jgi:hypothetical protein
MIRVDHRRLILIIWFLLGQELSRGLSVGIKPVGELGSSQHYKDLCFP